MPTASEDLHSLPTSPKVNWNQAVTHLHCSGAAHYTILPPALETSALLCAKLKGSKYLGEKEFCLQLRGKFSEKSLYKDTGL